MCENYEIYKKRDILQKPQEKKRQVSKRAIDETAILTKFAKITKIAKYTKTAREEKTSGKEGPPQNCDFLKKNLCVKTSIYESGWPWGPRWNCEL